MRAAIKFDDMKTKNKIKIDAFVLQESERQRCEIWTRVMGYHRPITSFNQGKKSEHKERVFFLEQKTKDELWIK